MPPFLLSIAQRYIQPVFATTLNFISWAPRLAMARLVAKWRSLLTIIAGVILGAGVGALVPLYTTAVSQLGMVQRLEQEPAHDSNARLRVSFRPSDFSSIEDLVAATTLVDREVVEPALQRYLRGGVLDGWLGSDEVVTYYETDKMGVLVAEEESLKRLNTENDTARASLIALEGWENQVRVAQGELPGTAPLAEGVDFNVAISQDVANEFGLQAGSILIVDQRYSRDGTLNPGAWETSHPFTVQITAVVVPVDEAASYWMAVRGEDDTPLNVITGSWPAEFRFFSDRAAVLTIMQDYAPQTPLTFGWRLLFKHDNLAYSRIDQARTALRSFDLEVYRQLALANPELVQRIAYTNARTETDFQYDYHTRLVEFSQTRADSDSGILQDYARKQEVNAVPFAVLLGEVGVLVLFFLMVTAALVRRGERRELAMLQSRGAYEGHILALRGIEALVICTLGAIIAPFIAQQLLVLMGPSVAGTDEFPLPLTQRVFVFSFLAAGVTMVALMLTLLPVLRMPLITAGGAATRGDQMPWWQRYYVDLMLAGVGVGGFVLLLIRDTPLLETAETGQTKIDPLLVGTPAMLFLGLGGLLLRLFPYMAASVSYVSSRRRDFLSALATWQVSREPVHYGRITFLLALAIGIGWFATTFRATLRNSQEDQAHYQVGSDVRMVERDTRLNVERVRDASYYENFDFVEGASVSYRQRVNQISRSSTSQYRVGELLGVDSSNFGNVAVEDYRPDLGNILVPYDANYDLNLPVVGEPLPATPAKIGIWARFQVPSFTFSQADSNYIVNLARLTQVITLGVRLQDETGTWLVVPFNRIRIEYLRGNNLDQPGLEAAAHVSSGWVYYEADLQNLRYQPQGQLRIVSLFWENRANNINGEGNVRLSLADLTLIDEAGSAEPFEILASNQWEFIADSGAESQGQMNPGQAGDNLHPDLIYVTFNQFALRSRMGININYPAPQPMDAVVSLTMAEINGLRIADCQDESAPRQPFNLINIAGTIVNIVPCATTEYFPSLYNEVRPYVIVDVHELMYALNQRPRAQFYPNEVWLEFTDEVSSLEQVNNSLSEIIGGEETGVSRVRETTYARVFDDLETDPLALGLLGLMYLAFLIGLALSIVGLLTYASLTSQERRSEFGVLRALGLASSRVVSSLLLEQVFVVAVAGVLGSLLGHLLSTFVVPTLALGATGEGVVPPFITKIEWRAIGNFWLIMLVVLAVVFSFSFMLVRQLSLSRTLRLGEE